jgi:Flp pilus assembly protein TadB
MNTFEFIYWVTFAVLGFVTGHQILLRQYTYRTISKKTLGFLIHFFLPTYIFLIWFIKSHLFLLVSVQVGLVFLEVLFLYLLSQRRLSSFRKKIIPFLDDISLNLSTGRSFRESILSLEEFSEYHSQVDLNEIIQSFKYQYEAKPLVFMSSQAQDLLKELQRIESSHLNTRTKLEALRNRIFSEQKIFLKVHIATSQAKAQGLVCSFLYVGMIIFSIITRSRFFESPLFYLSVLLFISGLILMRRLSLWAIKVKL